MLISAPCPSVLCRQPLSSICGPAALQGAAPLQAAHAQQSLQQSAQPQPQQPQHHHQQQHAKKLQAQAQLRQQQQQEPHGPQPQGQQQHRVRREDENSVVVRGTRYTKLECVGRGGSSKVTSPRVTSHTQHADSMALLPRSHISVLCPQERSCSGHCRCMHR